MESQPGGRGAGIIVAGQAARAVVKIFFHDPVRAFRAQVGTADPMIEAARQERRFVLDVVVSVREEAVQALPERLRAAAGRDQARHVVRHRQGILPTVRFIEEIAPPGRIPGSFEGGRRIDIAPGPPPGMAEGKRIQPAAVRRPRQDETAHAPILVVRPPEMAPVARTGMVFLVQVLPAETPRHGGDGRIAQGIFQGPVAGPGRSPGDIAQPVVVLQAAPAFGFVVRRRHFRILQHGLQGQLIVNTFQPLDEGVRNHDLGVRAALGPSVGIAAAGVGQITVVPVDGQQRIHDVPFACGIEQRDQRQRSAVGVPQGIIIIIIDFPACGRPFSGPVHRHQHRVVEGRVEHPPLAGGGTASQFHPAQQSVPLCQAAPAHLAE